MTSTPNNNNPFADADIIYRYTRKQAIEDGVLVDLTSWASETGFRIPVACTQAVWSDYIEPPEGTLELGQSQRGRAHDVLWMLYLAVKRSPAGEAALQLAALGAPHLQLVDFDTVEVENLAPQGFLANDVGRSKVAAVADQCRAINPAIQIDVFAQRFNRSVPRSDVVFCCVDSISARKRVYEQVRDTAGLFLDARMSAEVVRALAVDGSTQGDAYLQTCFAPDQAFAGACTAKSTIYTANIAAGLLVTQFTRWLRRLPVDRDVQLNLLSMELTVG